MMKKLVIIGNGTGVLRAFNGQFIDQCDRIIRMNDFVIKGYEKHVGTRVDIFACGPQHVLSRKEDSLKNINEFWFPFPFPRKGDARYDSYQQAMEKLPVTSRVCHLAQSEMEILENEQKQMGDLAKWCPSTGYRALEMALIQFPKYEIFLTGIDFFQGGWYWMPDKHWHLNAYASEERQTKVLQRHPVQYEEAKIEEYAKLGRIHLLT